MRFLTRVSRLPESLRSSRSDSLSCGMLFDRMR